MGGCSWPGAVGRHRRLTGSLHGRVSTRAEREETIDRRAAVATARMNRDPGAVPIPWRRAAPDRPRRGGVQGGRPGSAEVGERRSRRAQHEPDSVAGARIEHVRQVQAERDCPVSRARMPHRGVRRRSNSDSAVGQAHRTAHASRRGCRRCRPARLPTADSETSIHRLCTLRSAMTKLSDEVFELVVGNVRVPPRRNIRPALAGCLLQSP